MKETGASCSAGQSRFIEFARGRLLTLTRPRSGLMPRLFPRTTHTRKSSQSSDDWRGTPVLPYVETGTRSTKPSWHANSWRPAPQ